MQAVEFIQPNKAPGCFAAPSVFSHDSQVCRACPAFDQCASACIETLKALREQINVDDILARHRQAMGMVEKSATPASDKPAFDVAKYLPSVKKPQEKVERKVERSEPKPAVVPVSVDHQAVLESIASIKPRALAERWCKEGMIEKIREGCASKVNAFALRARQNFESVTIDSLNNGGFTRASLKKAFMTQCGINKPWDEKTAASHVNIIIPVLIAFDIAVESSGQFTLHPTLARHNEECSTEQENE